MAILSFLRRRTITKWADDKAVKDFTRVCEQTGLTEDQRLDEAAAIIGKDSVTGEDVERLARLIGNA